AAAGTTIGAGAASQITITGQPATAAQSGITLTTQPVIQLLDGAGNAVAQAGVQVTASIVSGSLTLSNATAITNAAGTASFGSLSLSGLTGAYTLRFSASGLGTATAGSATVLSAGTATQLGIFTQPSTAAQSGIALGLQPQIQVRDASGNPVGSQGVQVTAS